ncbi:(2Fe-2S)-binding protein [Paractinoplanes brasiliensis]|uniref:2Fe-2S iron-sulfur cluster protein n=1 Tax=Paractinoplanes brasiliensis TaxID=52695 RepID=A0A4R6JAU3_9ACTN|nr:2Fe-2S iron-sulfur cluster-binding protein [Actinoplanes brasiliensis]TDO31595.1 2Fe-2S iron-sulfur cluster protein [Actinoplanes brasiliensis]GID30994.1 hypothetical protein Abr02nite_59770 [Actinoplanes brasiliensis]
MSPVSEVTLHVNGVTRRLRLDHRRILVGVLRDDFGSEGTRENCDHGGCGACTVLIDGRLAASCLTLAVAVDGASITTIEGYEGV